MAIRRRRRRAKRPSDPGTALAKLTASLKACTEAVEQLRRENQTHIARMAAMQAEIDHLRALIGRND